MSTILTRSASRLDTMFATTSTNSADAGVDVAPAEPNLDAVAVSVTSQEPRSSRWTRRRSRPTGISCSRNSRGSDCDNTPSCLAFRPAQARQFGRHVPGIRRTNSSPRVLSSPRSPQHRPQATCSVTRDRAIFDAGQRRATLALIDPWQTSLNLLLHPVAGPRSRNPATSSLPMASSICSACHTLKRAADRKRLESAGRAARRR